MSERTQDQLDRPRPLRSVAHRASRLHPRRVPALLRVPLGVALALLGALIVTLFSHAANAEPAVTAVVRHVAVQKLVSTPPPTDTDDRCALVGPVVDADDDESSVRSDGTAPCDLPTVADFRVVRSSRAERTSPRELTIAKSRLVVDTRLARGPPAVRRSRSH